MSKRRKPGEIVKRRPGSGFVGSAEPSFVQIPEGKAFEHDTVLGPVDGKSKWVSNPGGQASWCMLSCEDDDCKEYANVKIIGGPNDGQWMYHISECELYDQDEVIPDE